MHNLYKHNDKAYLIIKKKSSDFFSLKAGEGPDMEKVQGYMKAVGADHVLRDAEGFIFCKTIEDVEFEEINEEL